ncbi:hypothetical protein V5799_031676 [Amblyomma americanum]|uniref:Uncharacterized protein n=1 Tax=Amblyomma americanum TaxID=6943 RepID=A0AAQ4DTC6_AMBAM
MDGAQGQMTCAYTRKERWKHLKKHDGPFHHAFVTAAGYPNLAKVTIKLLNGQHRLSYKMFKKGYGCTSPRESADLNSQVQVVQSTREWEAAARSRTECLLACRNGLYSRGRVRAFETPGTRTTQRRPHFPGCRCAFARNDASLRRGGVSPAPSAFASHWSHFQ